MSRVSAQRFTGINFSNRVVYVASLRTEQAEAERLVTQPSFTPWVPWRGEPGCLCALPMLPRPCITRTHLPRLLGCLGAGAGWLPLGAQLTCALKHRLLGRLAICLDKGHRPGTQPRRSPPEAASQQPLPLPQ